MLRASFRKGPPQGSLERKTCLQPVRALPANQPRQHRWRVAAGDDGGIDQFDDNSSSPAHGAETLAAAAQQLLPSDYGPFVQLFRQASPYIEGHRGKTFVVILPGSVCAERHLLNNAMSDLAQLHGLGVNLVVVTGVQEMVDREMMERGLPLCYDGHFRVTNAVAMKIAAESLGEVRTQVEQALSKGPAIPMIRRHTKGDGEIHFAPALNVVSGNYVTAKRRGVIDGVDFGLTGEVRFVMKDALRQQLSLGNIVLLGQMGYTASGEVLNCRAYDVGLQAAVGLDADKLICFHREDVADLKLPSWVSLSDAQEMLNSRVDSILSDAQQLEAGRLKVPYSLSSSSSSSSSSDSSSGASSSGRCCSMTDMDVWSFSGFPQAVSTCVMACCKGIKRAHLLDARTDGGLLLELYTRDGVGTMISTDFYEGIRRANDGDVAAIQGLLEPLVKAGILVKRSHRDLESMMSSFIVIERETKLMGCAMLLPLGQNAAGDEVAELGAFVVDSAFRGSGRGDSMLDYIEQEASRLGITQLVLLTTRTADWFEQREFIHKGTAYMSDLLPEERRKKIDPSRNSQLYAKQMERARHGSLAALAQPGKRIGA